MMEHFETSYYIYILIYNFDASPRYQYTKHFCGSEALALSTAKRLQIMMGKKRSENKTGRWLSEHGGIDGFIERIDGVFQTVTTRIN